jgi:hypothetical protein
MSMLPNEVGAHASCDAPTRYCTQRHYAVELPTLLSPHAVKGYSRY